MGTCVEDTVYGGYVKDTVHPESIYSASLFPHLVMLQPYSKVSWIDYFP